MKGIPSVIDRLNKLLTGELTAADQYFVHSRMYENWGFKTLYERLEHERVEELEHASRLIRRILFLDGIPDVASRSPLAIGADVPSMMKNDLAYELSVVANLKEVITHCEQVQDYETRHILRELLADTENDHTHWLEQQLFLINAMGLANYQQSAATGISA
ncbi:MAG: bacterioferritin [Rhodospirillaceae bacterium]|nr:bacterioferritin [Rhodospirillales bacterium]